jgi:hypothetical protein
MTTTTHTDNADHPATGKPSYDDVNTSAIFLVGIISAIVTILIISVVQGLCYHWQSSVTAEQNKKYSSILVKPIIDGQKKILEGGDGVLPITEAMNRVVTKYGKGQPNNSPDAPKSGQ